MRLGLVYLSWQMNYEISREILADLKADPLVEHFFRHFFLEWRESLFVQFKTRPLKHLFLSFWRTPSYPKIACVIGIKNNYRFAPGTCKKILKTGFTRKVVGMLAGAGCVLSCFSQLQPRSSDIFFKSSFSAKAVIHVI